MVEENVCYYLAQPITNFAKVSDNMKLEDFMINHIEAFYFGMKYVLEAERLGLTLFSPAVYTAHIAIERYSKNCIDRKGERAIWIGIDNKMTAMMRRSGILRWLFPIGWEDSIGCRDEFKEAIENKEIPLRLEEFFQSKGLVFIPVIGNYKSEKERNIVNKILDEVMEQNG